jgi:PP-loop superfamily ATP-utilizing enzyme
MSNGAPGTRSCTAEFKIRVIGKELKRRGATRDNPATVGIGISVDEIHRANARRAEAHEHIEYPLLDLGIRRADIPRIVHDAGLPLPPKSACWFCPFHRPETWAEMRRTEPELFARACALEELLNDRRDMLGRDHVYLTRFGRPLDKAIPDGVNVLPFDEGECDSGWCMT